MKRHAYLSALALSLAFTSALGGATGVSGAAAALPATDRAQSSLAVAAPALSARSQSGARTTSQAAMAANKASKKASKKAGKKKAGKKSAAQRAAEKRARKALAARKAAKARAAKQRAAARKAFRSARIRATAASLASGNHSVDRTFADTRIVRSSGLARSAYARDTLFTHNDAGDSNRLYAVNVHGRTRAVLRLKGISANDFEDIAAGPKNTLWVADIGDDSRRRTQITVHRITEPRLLPENGSELSVTPTTYRFVYPDGVARHAEALLVHPGTGRLHIVTRAASGAQVFAAPAAPSSTGQNRLTAIADAPSDITAGAFSPDGSVIVLTSPTHAYTYSRFGRAPSVTALPHRPQGASTEFRRDGQRLLIGSEGRYSSVLSVPVPRPDAAPVTPSAAPSTTPVAPPSTTPVAPPSATPSTSPSATTSSAPTASPSTSVPTPTPTSSASTRPTSSPTTAPSPGPAPSAAPTQSPTGAPSTSPTPTPSSAPVLAPEWKGTTTYFGTALSGGDGPIAEALAINDRLFGRMPVVRQFDPTAPPPGAWSRRTVLHDRVVVTSFREHPNRILNGEFDQQLLNYFKEAPTQKPIFWSYFHEPEPHIAAGEYTHAEYRAAWRHLVRLAAKAGKSNLYPTLILTGWTTQTASGRNWRDYYPGDEYISVVAWDPYNSATGTPSSYPNPETLYASVLKASKESGKPWGIAETGSAFVPGDDGTGRAAWLTKVGTYFRAQGAAFVTYFQSNRDGMFKLSDQSSIDAWAAFVQGRTD